MKKRILSTLLALCLCLTLLPTSALAEERAAVGRAGHTHCLCGTTHKSIGDHTQEQSVSFTAWESETELPSATGNYYLTKDVELSATWTPASGTVLCLNGHTVNAAGKGIAITVGEGKNFTLCDCAGTGKITGGKKASDAAGGVYIYKGTFYLYGGCITGNEGYYAGGVYAFKQGSFTMYGGSITENTGYTGADGVHISNSAFVMYGGSITDNGNGKLGGVCLSTATITLGGTPVIKGNGNKNLILNSADCVIKIADCGLQEGALIYVQTYGTMRGADESSFTEETNDAETYKNCFRGDPYGVYGYYVAVSGSGGTHSLKLVKCDHKDDGSDITDENGYCGRCEMQVYMARTTSTKYSSLNDAVTAVKKGSDSGTITLLVETDGASVAIPCTIDLNGKELRYLSVEENVLTLTDSAGGGKIEKLVHYDADVTPLNSGDGLRTQDGDTIKWYETVPATSSINGETLKNVTIQPLPIGSMTITGESSAEFSDFINLTAVPILGKGYNASNVTYAWKLQKSSGGELSLSWVTTPTLKWNSADCGGLGKATFTCTATLDGYTVTTTKDVTVTQKDISSAVVTGGEREYLGGPMQPRDTDIVVKVGDHTVSSDDYIVNAEEKDGVGEYQFTVTGTGNYTGTATGTWKIVKAELQSRVTMEGYTYGSTPSTPSVERNWGDGAATYYYYSTDTTKENAREWKDITGTTLNAGHYYIYAVIAETANYKSMTTDGITFSVERAPASVTSWPTIDRVIYVNDTLNEGDLSGGVHSTAGAFFINGTKTWSEAGQKTVNIGFTPRDRNYRDVNQDITIQVIKRTAKSVEAQTAVIDKAFGTAQTDLGLPTTVRMTTADNKTFDAVPVTWSGYNANTLELQTLTGTLDLTTIADEVQQPETPITASITVTLMTATAEVPAYPVKTEPYTGQAISHELDAVTGVASISYQYEGRDDTIYAKSETPPHGCGCLHCYCGIRNGAWIPPA